ncbi:MAG: peptidylprolyl isomerase [Eggerthellaceae bacterium]|nr:peptidylprolyl isomerase [Eggerthellaceae bacterium]
MKMEKFLKALIALGVISACSVLIACSGGTQTTGSGGAAATVNGTEIPEATVTDYVQNIRGQYGLDDDDSWGQFLSANAMTPESLREQTINSLVDKELLKSNASSLGITVEDSEIDQHVESMKSNFESEEAWQAALKQAGFTEESYRESIRTSLLQDKLNTHFQDNANVTDEDLLTAADTVGMYYDGAKRSSHILFKVDDKTDEAAMAAAREKAEAVLSQIKGGADFAELAKQNSDDTGSAEKGGDVGWDVTSNFVAEYTDALAELDKDEVSDLVETEYGIHIIKVTDVFNKPEKITKLDQLPKEFQDAAKEMAKSMKVDNDYKAWLEEQRKAANIVINPIPADASYNVDMSKYESKESGESDVEVVEGNEEGADEEGVDVELEEASSSEAAASESAESTAASGESASSSASSEAASSEASKSAA